MSENGYFQGAEVLYSTPGGRVLFTSEDGPSPWLGIRHGAAFTVMHVDQVLVNAIRMAVGLPEGSVLADVTALLAKMDENRGGAIASWELRELLGLPALCDEVLTVPGDGEIPCTRKVHPIDTPHVNKDRRLEWRTWGVATSQGRQNRHVTGWHGHDYDEGETDHETVQ